MAFTIQEFLEAKRLGMPYTGKTGTPATLKTYKMALQRVERLVGKRVGQFGPRAGESFLKAADEAGLSPSSRNQSITAARSMFDWAIAAKKYEGKNPFGAIRAQSLPRTLPKIMSHEQVMKLLDAIEEQAEEDHERALASHANTKNFGWASESVAQKYGLIFRVQYFAGLRISEVLGLKKRHVHDDGVVINGKGSKERFVPLPAEVVARLRSYIEKHPYTEYVFYGEAGRSFGIDTGKPMKGNKAYDVFKAGLKRAGLDSDFVPHSLRHSFATLALSKTGRIEVVKDFLGHANIQTTLIYAQVAQDELKSEYKKLFS